MYRAALAVFASLMLSSCFTTKIYYPDVTPAKGATHASMAHTFLWGAVTTNEVNAGAMCGQAGVAKTKSAVNGWGILISYLTGGIYIPVTVKVTCGQN